LIVVKNMQTRAPGDHTHPSPNVVEDDYRAIEIFPPKGESKTYSVTWLEDDGIAAQPEISSFAVRYTSTSSEVSVEIETGKDNKYVPIWKNVDVVLPVGDERSVVQGGHSLQRVKDSRGRAVFTKALN
jgi:hypothetical protein